MVPTAPLPLQRHAGGYYGRRAAEDRPGAVAAIASRMAERGIWFESIMQRRSAEPDRGYVPVVLITHATTETTIREALDAVEAGGTIAGKPQLIRIERR